MAHSKLPVVTNWIFIHCLLIKSWILPFSVAALIKSEQLQLHFPPLQSSFIADQTQAHCIKEQYFIFVPNWLWLYLKIKLRDKKKKKTLFLCLFYLKLMNCSTAQNDEQCTAEGMRLWLLKIQREWLMLLSEEIYHLVRPLNGLHTYKT